MAEKSLLDINLARLCDRQFFPSPAAWEDQVLYFLLLDRFSDGNEQGYRGNNGRRVRRGSTPLFQPTEANNAIQTPEDAHHWREAGARWAGGTLPGLTSKIGYLQRLGVTAIWVSPIFKQTAYHETYHGYGIHNFLDVDPHFGTRADLIQMVDTAHRYGIYVILDIIFNHAGDVFAYHPDRYATGTGSFDPRWDGRPYAVQGFHDAQGTPNLPFAPLDLQQHPTAWPDGAIWPAELQHPASFSQQGHITNWDYEPEFLHGDFFSLKDLHLGGGSLDAYRPSPTLLALCQAYKFWMACADLDGFRIDTVKHMDLGATRFLTAVLHEFAASLGKENFYLIGEITGGRERAVRTLEATGLDAALGIDDIPDKLEYLVKGQRNPSEYFRLFRNSTLVQKDSHVWFRNKIVTVFDDHDQVRKGVHKARFGADEVGQKSLLTVLALNATTLGIPCIYYGTEQGFDGAGDNDRYIRETMFGGAFGAFRSRERHFFNEDTPVYRELAQILAIRQEKIVLRRGRQYLREISGDGEHFGLPHMIGTTIRSVVPWSRIFHDQEMLLAINTDPEQPQTAWVLVDNDLHRPGDHFQCLYTSDASLSEPELTITDIQGQMKAVRLTVPAAGFVIYE